MLKFTAPENKNATELIAAGAILKKRVASLELARRAYQKSLSPANRPMKEKLTFLKEDYLMKGIREVFGRL